MRKFLALFFLIILPVSFAIYIDPTDPRNIDKNRYIDPTDKRPLEPSRYVDTLSYDSQLHSINLVKSTKQNIDLNSLNSALTIFPIYNKSTINFFLDLNQLRFDLNVPSADANISGSGTATFIPKWLTSNSLGNSNIFMASDGNIGIGTTNPRGKLNVLGDINLSIFRICNDVNCYNLHDLNKQDSGSTIPAGVNTNVQFNNNGIFGADANFDYNSFSEFLFVPNIRASDSNNARPLRLYGSDGNSEGDPTADGGNVEIRAGLANAGGNNGAIKLYGSQGALSQNGFYDLDGGAQLTLDGDAGMQEFYPVQIHSSFSNVGQAIALDVNSTYAEGSIVRIQDNGFISQYLGALYFSGSQTLEQDGLWVKTKTGGSADIGINDVYWADDTNCSIILEQSQFGLQGDGISDLTPRAVYQCDGSYGMGNITGAPDLSGFAYKYEFNNGYLATHTLTGTDQEGATFSLRIKGSFTNTNAGLVLASDNTNILIGDSDVDPPNNIYFGGADAGSQSIALESRTPLIDLGYTQTSNPATLIVRGQAFLDQESNKEIKLYGGTLDGDNNSYIYRGDLGNEKLGINTASPTATLDVNGSVKIRADLNFTGIGKGLTYGDINAFNKEFTVSVASAGVFYPISTGLNDITALHNNTQLIDGNSLKILQKGVYLVTWSVSAKDGANTDIMGTVGVNGVPENKCAGNGTSVTASNFSSLNGTCLLSVNANDKVNVFLQNETSANNIVWQHVTLTVIQVGG